MPSLIGEDAGSGVNVAANYLVTANPTTQFGTRELSFLKVTKTGFFTTAGATTANSNFSKVVRAIQQTAELYAFQRIDDDNLAIVVSKDTLPTADSATDQTAGYGLFEAAINAGSGTTGVAVAAAVFA
jgi:hypothetical protein